MSRYVDGFIIPIKKKNLTKYKKMATIGRKIWMKYGALDYYECVGAKLNNDWGLSFPKLVKLKKDEILIFAFIIYKSKSHRDSVNKKMMKDPMMNSPANQEMPFDLKRFTSGEFKAIIHS